MIACLSRSRLAGVFVTLVVSGTGSATAQTPQVKAPTDETAVLTETVILLAGLQLHNTHVNVGLLAEARYLGVHEASELAQRLRAVVRPLEDVENQLAKVAALKGLSKTDAATIARLRKIAALLKEQGTSLQAFWDTGVEDQTQKYDAARKAAWKELNSLLDLEPKKGTAPPPREPTKKP